MSRIRKAAITGVGLVAAAALAAPALAVPLGGGATVTNGARGQLEQRVKIKTHPDRDYDAVAANINLPAGGGYVDWHTHPGPVVGIVTGGGTLTIIGEDCVAHEYPTGSSFIAPQGVHTARNFSDADVTVRGTFIVPRGAAPTVFALDRDDELDATCGLTD